MLAALIATRSQPTPPPVFFYSNQFVAATTTFTCISLTKRAAVLSTNPVFSYQLLFSLPGRESILSQLDRLYYTIVNYLSSNANTISMPSDLYLSNQIAAVIISATTLNGIIQSLPVASGRLNDLADLQRSMGIALRLLKSLAVPITLNYT